MKIENITEHMVISNYKRLCNLLDIEVKSGNTKIAQMQELARYFEYDKIGQKIHIKRKYDKPLDKSIKVKSYKSLELINDLYYNLLYLLKKEDSIFIISASKLYSRLNMVNNKYIVYKYKTQILSDTYEIPGLLLCEYFNTTYNTLKRLLKKVINLDVYEDKVLTEISSNLVLVLKKDNNIETRYATDEEVYEVNKIRNKSMHMMNCSSLQEVIRKGKWEMYYNLVNLKLQDYNEEIQFTYKPYKFISDKEIISSEIKEINPPLQDKLKVKINNEIYNRLKLNAERRYKKSPNKYPEDYLTQHNKFLDIVIKI